MKLFELFSEPMKIGDRLKQAALDLLTPMAGQKVEFATIGQIIDELRQQRPGIVIDRALVMDLLSPDKVELVKKIEGDRIYLQLPEPDSRDLPQDEETREKEKISQKAVKQAMKQAKGE